MIDRTKLPALRKRPRRRRRHHGQRRGSFSDPIAAAVAGPKVMAALGALILGTLWTVGVLFFSLTVHDDGIGRHAASYTAGRSLDSLPSRNINLWPNDQTNLILDQHLADCLPRECTLASPPVAAKKDEDQPIVVTVLRPPGVFGSILESFTREFVKTSVPGSGTAHEIRVHATSQAPPAADDDGDEADMVTADSKKQEQQYYVHAITLPLLLQAADLALLTVDPDDTSYSKDRITWNDLLDVIVLLVRWHCRISKHIAVSKRNYLMKLALAPTLARPTKAERDLARMLGIRLLDNNNKNNNNHQHYALSSAAPTTTSIMGHPSWVVDRSNLTIQALHRVDQATALLRQMEGFLPGDHGDDLQEAIDLLLQDEFRSAGDNHAGDDGGADDDIIYCPTQPLRSGGIAGLGLFRWHSRMIDIVDLLLDDNAAAACQEYPTIAYCRDLHHQTQQQEQ